MIPPSLCGSKHADTLLGDRNDVLFRFDRKAKTHCLLPRVVSARDCRSKEFVLRPAANTTFETVIDEALHAAI